MTRKEAIKILQDYPNCTVGQLSEVPVKAVLEFMETIPHWISVEDDFPKKTTCTSAITALKMSTKYCC